MTTLLAPRTIVRGRTDWRVLADRRLLPLVVLGYLLCRAFSAVLLIWVARHQPVEGVPGGVSGAHPTYWDETRMWDGRWYQEIAGRGYPRQLPVDPDGKVAQNAWAFMPLYPLAAKSLMLVTGASFAVAGSLLSLVLGAAAVAVMAVLLRDRIGAPAALASVIVFSALPPAVTLQMTYTESLALLVLMGFLLALERGQWTAAALLALVMGLTRPIAAPMVLVVLVLAVTRWRERRTRPVRRRDWAGMAAVAAAGLVATVLWSQIVGLVTGVPSAYLQTEGAWRLHGVVFFVPWAHNFTLLFGRVGAVIALVSLLATFVTMVAGPWARALGPVLLGWTVAYAAYLVATVDVWTSTYRYAMFLFPLVPVALGVGWVRRERRVLVPLRCTIFVLLSLGWQVWWVWTLLRFVPPVGNPI